ncbi:unnamed protein product [Effrenium voratum]|uniref:Fe2OG dioxygenase domain-containing protein n=1 Tax=Effrenium voratum TaxID=2562239 RepID=A0AA36JH61_9DINO|nr:unnamed protein product [Effrenium voratum]
MPSCKRRFAWDSESGSGEQSERSSEEDSEAEDVVGWESQKVVEIHTQVCPSAEYFQLREQSAKDEAKEAAAPSAAAPSAAAQRGALAVERRRRRLTELRGASRASALAEAAAQLRGRGFVVWDHFLGAAESLLPLLARSDWRPGRLGDALSTSLRGDRVAWPSLEHPELRRWLQALDDLVADLRPLLDRENELRTVTAREPPMASCYPRGARYIRHYDNNCEEGQGDCNGRRLTAVYYLNEVTESDGGHLRIMGQRRVYDILPALDTLVLFWADRRTPHEVLPNRGADRYALSCWYVDLAEAPDAPAFPMKNHRACLPPRSIKSDPGDGGAASLLVSGERDKALAQSPETGERAEVHHNLKECLQRKAQIKERLEWKERIIAKEKAWEEEEQRKQEEKQQAAEEEARRRKEREERLERMKEERKQEERRHVQQVRPAAGLESLPKVEEVPGFAELRLLEQTLQYCKKLLPKNMDSVQEKKPIQYNNPDGSLIIVPKEERSEEYLFAPPKPRRHEGKVNKRPPTSKLKKTRTEGEQEPVSGSTDTEAEDLELRSRFHRAATEKSSWGHLPGHRRLRGHGSVPAHKQGPRIHVHWPKVHIDWGPEWHYQLVQVLQSNQYHLKDEGKQFRVEDCKGHRFKAQSKHSQDRSLFPLTLYLRKSRPAWQDCGHLVACNAGHTTTTPLEPGKPGKPWRLRPLHEATWPLAKNIPPRSAHMATKWAQRGFLVDQLLDALQRSSTCECGNRGIGEDSPSRSMKEGMQAIQNHQIDHQNVGHRCPPPRCQHCAGVCDCLWKSDMALLIEERADVNGSSWRGVTPLLLASGHGHVRVVTFFLALNADPLQSADPEGWTPLHEAARLNRAGTCDALLEACEDQRALLEARCQRREAYFHQTTAVLVAAEGRLESLQVLIKYKANLDARREDGNTPLMLATAGGYYEVCRLLLSSGCLVCGGLGGRQLREAMDAGRPKGGCRLKCRDKLHLPLRNKKSKSAGMLARHSLRQHHNFVEIALLLESKGVQ